MVHFRPQNEQLVIQILTLQSGHTLNVLLGKSQIALTYSIAAGFLQIGEGFVYIIDIWFDVRILTNKVVRITVHLDVLLIFGIKTLLKCSEIEESRLHRNSIF